MINPRPLKLCESGSTVSSPFQLLMTGRHLVVIIKTNASPFFTQKSADTRLFNKMAPNVETF